MTTFADTTGRPWVLSITTAHFRAARERVGVDLNEYAADPTKLFVLFDDLPRFCDLLYLLVEPQARALGVTDEQFGAAMSGDVFDAAFAAFLDAYANFSPSQTRRVVRSLAARWRQVTEAATADLVRRIESRSPSSGPAGDSPDSPASTPAA